MGQAVNTHSITLYCWILPRENGSGIVSFGFFLEVGLLHDYIKYGIYTVTKDII